MPRALTTMTGALVLASALAGQATADYTLAATRLHAVAEEPASLAAGDLDGDGDVDVAISNATPRGGSVVFATNDGNGNLTFAAAIAVQDLPGDIVLRDFDADGSLDVAVATGEGITLILGGNGLPDRTAFFPTGTAVVSLTAADVDGDGDDDLAFLDPYEGLFGTMTTEAGALLPGARVKQVSDFASGLAALDVDGDGDVDFVTSEENPFGGGTHAPLFINQGGAQDGVAGRFAAARGIETGVSTTQPTALDANGDGLSDIALSAAVGGNDGFGVLVQQKREDASPRGLPSPFVLAGPMGPTFLPMQSKAGDLDGDGDDDLMFTFFDGLLPALNRTGAGGGALVFEIAPHPEGIAPERPRGLVLADMDGDGDLDAVTAQRFSGFRGVTVAPNLGGAQGGPPGTFSRSTYWPMRDEEGRAPARALVAGGRVFAATGGGVVRSAQAGTEWDAAGVEVMDAGVGPMELIFSMDADGDGVMDVVAIGAGGMKSSIHLAGSTGFEEIAAPEGGIAEGLIRDAVGWSPGPGESGLAVLTTEGVRAFRLTQTEGGFALEAAGWGATEDYPEGMDMADLDGDGVEEIIAGDMLLRLEDGGLTTQKIGEGLATHAQAGDFDGDGDIDLLLGGSELQLFVNDGGDFVEAWETAIPAGQSGRMIASDIDRDGDLDAMILLPAGEAIGLYVNPGNGALAEPHWFYVHGEPTDAALADWNGDGVLDVVVSARDEGAYGGLRVLYGLSGSGSAAR